MSLRAKMIEIDLNEFPVVLAYSSLEEGRADEYRENHFFATHGLFSTARVSSLCGTISGWLQGTEFFLSGSVSLSGLRPTNLPRKSPRHRSLLAGPAIEARPHGLSRP